MKIVGNRAQPPTSALEALRRAEKLISHANRLSPTRKPRGFVVKAKTREFYEEWKRAQSNPRLW